MRWAEWGLTICNVMVRRMSTTRCCAIAFCIWYFYVSNPYFIRFFYLNCVMFLLLFLNLKCV
jgi:hypothetical protein